MFPDIGSQLYGKDRASNKKEKLEKIQEASINAEDIESPRIDILEELVKS